MSEQRDTAVIYTGGAAASPAPAMPAPVAAAGAPAMPPLATPPAPGTDFAPIVTRGAIDTARVPIEVRTPEVPRVNYVAGMASPEAMMAGIPRAESYMQPGATPLPSILHQPQPSQSADPTLPRLRSLPVKEFLIGRSHFFVIGTCVIASIMYIASWGAAVAYEDHGKLKRRHVASIMGFIFQFITTVAVVITIRQEPTLWKYYILQMLALLTLFLTTVGMGMNNVVVDLCTVNMHQPDVLCPAHIAEFFAAFFVSISMALVFFASQQRIAVLIDKGILSNIRGRMTQL